MNSSGPGAVVVGGIANGLGVARSLGEKGIPVSVILTQPQDIAHHSRYVSEHERLSDLPRRPESLVDLLERRSDWTGRVVIPTNDHALAILARHRERLSQQYRIPVPPLEIARGVLEKDPVQPPPKTSKEAPKTLGPVLAHRSSTIVSRGPPIVK